MLDSLDEHKAVIKMKHRAKLAASLCIALLSVLNAVRIEAGESHNASFNPSGDYHPVELRGNASERFTHFDLQVKRRGREFTVGGDVRADNTSYRFASVRVTANRLRFSTVTKRGVRYEFEGRFLGGGDFAAQFTGYGLVMLEGTLRRYVNNKKVVELVSPFLYYPGC
jgi:hypothetical protein